MVVKQIVGQRELKSPKKETITVKVWNGTKKKGLALDVSRRLRAAGYDVVELGNASARQTVTRVIDRFGTIEKAKNVAQTLKVDSVFSEVNPQTRADVEVILGDDYKKFVN